MASITKNKRIIISIILSALAIPLSLLICAGLMFPTQYPVQPDADDQLAEVNGYRIRYHVEGDNEPLLVLLHGFGGALTKWKEIQPMLAPHRSISLDLAGFGGSDRPAGPYDLESQRQKLIAFLDKLNTNKVILAGVSMGASLAAWTAAKTPERIKGLILLAPSGIPDSLSYPIPMKWFYRPGLPNQLAYMLVDNPVFRWLFPNSIAAQALSVTRSYNQGFANAIGEIQAPTLLAWSRGDKTALFKYHTEYTNSIKDLTFHELPPLTGHGVLRFYPAGTARLINDFVKRLAQPKQ